MFAYLYLDESGDLGAKGSQYLILAALLITNPALLTKCIRNMRRHKFRKELRKVQEIKANKSSDDLRRHMLLALNKIPDAKVFYIVLEKKKLLSIYLRDHKHRLYDYVAGKLAKSIILYDIDLEIRIDKSKGKQLLQQMFNDLFAANLRKSSSVKIISIHHSPSHSWAGLQFVDILAWACFQKFEHRDSTFLDLLSIEQEVHFVWQKNCST